MESVYQGLASSKANKNRHEREVVVYIRESESDRKIRKKTQINQREKKKRSPSKPEESRPVEHEEKLKLEEKINRGKMRKQHDFMA